MDEFHVAGVAVGVTDSNKTVMQKGYGEADISAGVPAGPESTLFRPGSITKLFTWTAVMQLEEQGLLELTDPVEDYLDFELPDTFSEPIRIIDLMNHTPGFADRLIGLFVTEEKYRKSLEQSVKQDIPRRVRPPGAVSSYSNYGTMLAGYIVQRLTGTPYEQYVEEHIFEPLGMSRSTMIQPPPEMSGVNMARGYTFSGDTFHQQPFEIVNGAPAGALSSTCSDILRFYRAYLRNGSGENGTILKPETVRAMRETSFRHDPRANGMAHGFMEIGTDDYPVLGHGGDTMYFHSLSGYFPTEGWAYYISTNTSTGNLLAFELQQMMFNEFLPVPDGKTLAAETQVQPDLTQYTGVFSMDRRAESDPTQILGLVALLKPAISEDGSGLFIKSILDPLGSVYLPVDEDIFQQEGGRLRVVFLRNSEGEVESVYSNDAPVFIFKRPPWIESPYLNFPVLGIGIILLLSVIFAPPIGLLTLIPGLRRRFKNDKLRLIRFSIWGYVACIAAQILVVIGLGNIIFKPIGPQHVIPVYLAALSLPVMITGAALLWRLKEMKKLGRIYVTVFTAAQVLFIALLGYWGFFFV